MGKKKLASDEKLHLRCNVTPSTFAQFGKSGRAERVLIPNDVVEGVIIIFGSKNGQ